MPKRLPWILICCACAFAVIPHTLRAQAVRPPVKILLSIQRQIPVGGSTALNVTLANLENKPSATLSTVGVDVQVECPNEKTRHFTVPIAKGQTSGKLTLVMPVAGVCKIRASESHFMSGNIFILVTGSHKNLTQRVKVAMRGTEEHWENVKVRDHIEQVVEFSVDTSRPMIADGKDSAQIFLSLSKEATSDMQIDVMTNQGEHSIVIPKGKMFAVLNIASEKSDDLKFRHAQVSPSVPVKGLPFDLNFIAPIAEMSCIASPPDITLIQDAEIVITLLDASKMPHKTLFPRTIALQINKGRGEMDSAEIVIPAGSFQGRTHFRPTILGGITISSMAEELPKHDTNLSVSIPIFILILSILGGVAGGFLAKQKDLKEHWRILSGMITGFLLYWAFIIGLLHVISHDIALNPFSAFGLSAIGGWMGSSIFNIVLPKL